ncbi:MULTISPECIES: hypothetical protein [Bacillus]|uniref:hypothetical protein n=1 Tax=Bacillus TaxID=1386 RepID=UPI0004789A4D|nr:hypothetical protein M654_008965 [Bacillus sp. NSP9.1]
MKQEAQVYSPPPWRIVRTSSDLYIYSAYSQQEKQRFPYSNGRLIAQIADYTAFSQQKNAHLIAAAPELLTASKLALAYLRSKGPAAPESIEGKLIHVLNKVISKAETQHEEESE